MVVAPQSEPAKEDQPSDFPTPLVTIEPSRAWKPLNPRDLWIYRELLYFLTWRDVKIRYKQSVFGIAWVVLQPLLMTIIFTVFLGMLAKVPFEGRSYAVFACAGLVPWIFFSSAISTAGASVVGNAHLITKVFFPRMIIPLAAIGARLVDFAFSFTILIGLLLYYQTKLTWNLLLLPAAILLMVILATGCGLLLSAVNVKYRDVGVAIPVLVQFWMFVSPIIYSSNLVPGRWRTLYALNPLVGILDCFRASLLGGPLDRPSLAISTAITLALLVYSAFVFRRMEKDFADAV